MLLRKGLLMPAGQVVDHLRKTATSYGLPLGDIIMTYSTWLLQELGLWAQEKGKGPAFQAEGFKAYFVDNVNIANQRVLLEPAGKAGLDTTEARTVVESRRYSGLVETDHDAVRELEIVAAPTYLMGGKRLVGAQSYDNLARFVTANGAQAK